MSVSLLKANRTLIRTVACNGSLNAAKPCTKEATVQQVHRHTLRSKDPAVPASIDLPVSLCDSHAARLTVGKKVRGVEIVSQRRL